MVLYGKKTLLSRFVSAILCLFVPLCLVLLAGCEEDNTAWPSEIKPGYYHSQYEGSTDKGAAFLVCGTGGRLDRVFEDGTLENVPLPVGDKDLTNVLISGDITLVGGLSGGLAFSRDGKVFEASKGADNAHITGLAQFNGKYYACTYSGKILSSADGVTWKTSKNLTDKPLIAIAADDSYIVAITDDTDIFKSADDSSWDSWNYNERYDGLSEKLSFQNLMCTESRFYCLGYPVDNPSTPTVMFSFDGGESWMNVVSQEINNRSPYEFYPLAVRSVSNFGDNLLAACDRGRVLIFSDCPSCNMVMNVLNVDLHCIAVCGSDAVLVAGEDFEFSVLSKKDIEDFSISIQEADGDFLY